MGAAVRDNAIPSESFRLHQQILEQAAIKRGAKHQFAERLTLLCKAAYTLEQQPPKFCAVLVNEAFKTRRCSGRSARGVRFAALLRG